ncbi:MAG: type II secretion system F family protein [Vulcanimicrobiota bacterium]
MTLTLQDSGSRILFNDAARFVTEKLGADRALVLYGPDKFEVRASHGFGGEQVLMDGSLSLSVLEVAKAGRPILSQDAQQDEGLRDQLSVMLSEIRSVICVPLWGERDRVVGLLYGDTLAEVGTFTKDHLSALQEFARKLERALARSLQDTTLVAAPVIALQKPAAPRPRSRPAPIPRSAPRSDPPKANLSLAPATMVMLLRCLAAMIGSGIPIHRALGLLRGDEPALDQVCLLVEKTVLSGRPLSAGMHACGAFSPFQVRLVECGERSGALHEVLAALAAYQERTHALNTRLRGALVYPAFLMALSLLILAFGLPYVLSGQLELLRSSGATLPLPTRLVLLLSDLSHQPLLWVVLMVVVGAGYLGLTNASAGVRRAWQKGVLTVPGLGPTLRVLSLTRFARALALQLRAGVNLTQALPGAAAVADQPLLEEAAGQATQALLDGSSLAESLEASAFFPNLFVEMVRVGEETGSPGSGAEWLANLYDQQLEFALETFAAVLEPLILAVVGGIVGFLLLATMLPMVSLIGAL